MYVRNTGQFTAQKTSGEK